MREWRALETRVSKAARAPRQATAEATLTKKETVEDHGATSPREGDLLAIPMDEFGWLQANLAEAREWLEQVPTRGADGAPTSQRLVKEYANRVESNKIAAARAGARG